MAAIYTQTVENTMEYINKLKLWGMEEFIENFEGI